MKIKAGNLLKQINNPADLRKFREEDLEQICTELRQFIIDSVSEDDLIAVVPRLDEICAMGGQRLRHLARPLLGLELAHERYRYVYSKLN